MKKAFKPLAFLIVLLTKSAKLLKFGKFFLTFLSMALSVLVYSLSWGWWFAVAFVLVLFVHEMGHVIAMSQKGHKALAPVFIPMLGAVVFAPKFTSRDEEAYVGFGGPLAGAVISLLVFVLWAILPGNDHFLLVVSFISTFINLFNLLPIRPLDGGRVTQAVGPWFTVIGFAGLIALTALIKQPSILMIWLVILVDLKINAKVAFSVGLICFVVMVVLFCLGHGEQLFWINVMDAVIGWLLVVTLYGKAIGKLSNESEKELPPRAYSLSTYVAVSLSWSHLFTVRSSRVADVLSAN
ncbi:MAG TPA: site-2 protease family protein [Patescibacteria group bacterium]|nr:site-2 protease family protein [Patescibacteria group bacterium]